MDRAFWMVFLALLMQILTQHLFTQPAETGSEIIAWAMLAILFKNSIQRNPILVEYRSLSLIQSWMIAIMLCVSSWFKTEIGILSSFPILFPLLLISAKLFNFRTHISARVDTWSAVLTESIYGSSVVALMGTFTLGSTNILQWCLSAIPMGCGLAILIILSPRHGRTLPSHINLERPLFDLASRVLLILVTTIVIEMWIFGLSRGHPLTILALGTCKGLAYYFTIQTIVCSSWGTAILIETFSLLAANSPFKARSGVSAFLNLLTSLLVLLQITLMLPRFLKGRSILLAFGLVTIVPYFANIWAIHTLDNEIVPNHPVTYLMEEARHNFHEALHKQSGTYQSACEEYRHRYKIEPPVGFEEWYKFASASQSPIIDDFDVIYSSIRPLLNLSGKEINENLINARNLPDNDLWSCTFFGRLHKTECSHGNRVFDRHIQDLFNSLLDKIPTTLPDVTFLVNHLDEPRIIFPSSTSAHNDLNIKNQARQSTWHTLTDACAYHLGPTEIQKRDSGNHFRLPFVIDHTLDKDLCLHPEYGAIYGMFLSPTSFRPIQGLVPVLSTGALSTMGDVLYPSPAYMEAEFQYSAEKDIDWGKKKNNLYWAGSTTGAFAINDNWRQFQRQRFVSLVQNLERRLFSYLYQDSNGLLSLRRSNFLNTRLFDVTFNRIFQCETKYCRDQRHFFHTQSWADKDKGLQSRLVFDLDGNGISGRFYRLLASKSAPLKQTLLREWHDDRLKPWVHYIPVSQSMEELPELVRYFTSKSGQMKAKEIAENGYKWFAESFRPVDMTIYLYRLLLEIARLQDVDRPAFG